MRASPVPLALTLVLAACTASTENTSPETGRPVGDHVVVTAVACGDLITTDVRLEADLTCAGDALIVNEDDISINLNGHTISGNGTGNGITVRLRSGVTIHGGTIQGFLSGILVAQSNDNTVKDNSFTLNREAVFLNGASGNVIKSNLAWQNTQRGFMVRPTGSGLVSTDNQVVDNTLIDNPSGILIFGQSGNTLKGNTISGSSVGAFDLTGGGGTGNIIKENLLSTSAAGIKFGPGWSSGNDIIGNTIHANTCGLAGNGTLNTFKDNMYSANTTDICP